MFTRNTRNTRNTPIRALGFTILQSECKTQVTTLAQCKEAAAQLHLGGVEEKRMEDIGCLFEKTSGQVYFSESSTPHSICLAAGACVFIYIFCVCIYRDFHVWFIFGCVRWSWCVPHVFWRRNKHNSEKKSYPTKIAFLCCLTLPLFTT